MWHLIKNEIKYSWPYATVPLIGLVAYSYFALSNIQLTTVPEFEIDYWGGILSFIMYAFLIGFWGNRIKEKRNRLLSPLPLTLKQKSFTRFFLSAVPFLFLTIYLTIIHLAIIDNWHSETSSMLGQVGITLIFFATFIKTRDDWFSNWNLRKRFQKAFVTVLIIQVIVVFVFLEMPELKMKLVNFFGSGAHNWAALIFIILGVCILSATFYSFNNRKSYLS